MAGAAPGGAIDAEVTAYERRVAETIVRPSARPVLAIRDNKVTTEFLGPDSETWAARIDGATRHPRRRRFRRSAAWSSRTTPTSAGSEPAGWSPTTSSSPTGTSRASSDAARPDGFVFRVGVNGGPQSAHVDFLEEFDRSASLEFAIESILWIATPNEPDVAYLRVKRPAARRGAGRRRFRSPSRCRRTTSSSRSAIPRATRACRISGWSSESSATSTRRSAWRPVRSPTSGPTNCSTTARHSGAIRARRSST